MLRNLVQPLWLSRPDQRADVVLGNPPWIAYRYLSAEMKTNLREACVPLIFWVGGVLTTQQDISALFWARCAERYLKPAGVIAFVLPYAALNHRPLASCGAANSACSTFKLLRRGVSMRPCSRSFRCRHRC